MRGGAQGRRVGAKWHGGQGGERAGQRGGRQVLRVLQQQPRAARDALRQQRLGRALASWVGWNMLGDVVATHSSAASGVASRWRCVADSAGASRSSSSPATDDASLSLRAWHRVACPYVVCPHEVWSCMI